MSGDLHRALFEKKLREVESRSGINIDEEAENTESTAKGLAISSAQLKEKYEFQPWNKFFDRKETVSDSAGNTFMTYYTPPKSNSSPLFVFHHGAGSSALTFGPLAKELVEQMNSSKNKNWSENTAGVFTFDARGHGDTILKSGTEIFSLEAFVDDAIFLIQNLIYRENLQENSIFLVGHSLGGSILTKVCYSPKIKHIKGLAMLDIVEDTAVQALQGMHSYLRNLPESFETLSEALDHHFKTRILRNLDTATTSVPPLFKWTGDRFVWSMDLRKTVPFWDGWFTGLSKCFVNAPTSKLLVLAGTDSLDKDLMIGQMQGKYQLVVFQDSGHFVQEDVPKKTAVTLIDFWERNDRRQSIKSTWGTNH